MARIRTIKPEFPQSESMGRVSREARLCFIMIWTICDDAGRVRGSSRMLASLLYPYDDDAPKLIGGWLDELEREGCISRYQIGNDTYLESLNWLKHQKIDRPSPSRLPSPDASSRSLAKPREASATDLVPSTVDQDLGSSSLREDISPKEKRKSRKSLPETFPLPSDLTWANEYWLKRGRVDLCQAVSEEVEKFRDHHSGKLTASADWSGSWRTWVRNAIKFNNGGHSARPNGTQGKRPAINEHLAGLASLHSGYKPPDE